MRSNTVAGSTRKLCRVVLSLGWVAVLGWWSVGYSSEKKMAPDITGQTWLNSAPMRMADLRGKVVLVEFWTFGCYNCRNVEPHVKEWHSKYAEQGLVVIGVHTPESNFERSVTALEDYLRKQQIRYPVVTDNDFAIWERYSNRAWPTVYLVDKQGLIRYTRIGEGSYAQTEQQIKTLLAEP